MKKLLIRSGLAVGTLGVILAGAAAFSAFEAHVVNVTATIENATDITTSEITFGNVFPEEVLHSPVTLSLSDSFTSANNTNAQAVDYFIKQKPKCMGIPQTSTSGLFAQVTDVPPAQAGGPITFACPSGYTMMPLLCPYVSKTSPRETDTNVPSFHGPTDLASWTDAVSDQTEAIGHLSKPNALSTTWDIDLHTPCFKGECAQDWDSYVHGVNPNVIDPTVYEADPKLQGQAMGCDLWFELYNVGTSNQATPTPTPSPTPTPTPVIVKITANDLDNSSSSPAVVATDGQNKWFMYNDTNDTIDNTLGTYVVGPATPPFGTGSVAFTLAASPLDRKNMATYRFSGTSLASITQMSFGVYSHSGVAGPSESPFFNFNVDFTGSSGTFQHRLVYVPSANGATPQDTWNSYDVINGGNAKWQFSGAVWPTATAGPDNGVVGTPGTTTKTWSTILADYPSIRLLPVGGWLGIRVGEPGPTGYTGNVNFFSIATGGVPTVYEFSN